MAKNRDVTTILNEARQFKREYKWIEAARCFEAVLSSVLQSGDRKQGAEVLEQVGFCYCRAATQAKDLVTSPNYAKLAMKAYEKAADLFGREQKVGYVYSCDATIAYIGAWLASTAEKRKELLDECWKLYLNSLETHERNNDESGYVKTCNTFLDRVGELVELFASDWGEKERVTKKALELGEKTIAKASVLGDDYELARAYAFTSHFCSTAYFFGRSDEERKSCEEKSSKYAQKALEISEKLKDAYLINDALSAAFSCPLGASDPMTALKYAKEALQCARTSKDHFDMGMALYGLGNVMNSLAFMQEDPSKKREAFSKAIEALQKAEYHSNKTFCGTATQSFAFALQCGTYCDLADIETDLQQKRLLLKKATETGRRGLEYAQLFGSPEGMIVALHSLSKALYFLSVIETESKVKKELLEEALKTRENETDIRKRLFPFDQWFQGVDENYLALIRAELAKEETDGQNRKGLLVKAVLNMENCLTLCRKYIELRPEYLLPTMVLAFGKYHDWFAQVLDQLYELTSDQKILNRTIEVHAGAIEAYDKVDSPSRVAEKNWQIAKTYDKIGEYAQAAKNFELASEKYLVTASRIPSLKAFYEEYSLYMRSWCEIEKAKHVHLRESYDEAKEHYKKAANILQSSKTWGYFVPNFSAWAQLEHAEDLSRKEESQESIKAFREAARLFEVAKTSLRSALSTIESSAEREKVDELSKASDLRREYCEGRICLEEAKIIASEGNYSSSADKYQRASEIFQKILEALETENERQEIRPIISLCKAWQKMMTAEKSLSPELYEEAAQLFQEAKELSPTEKIGVLASGNNYMCKALGAGLKFESTGEDTLYSTAKKYMESAATCYMKTGFEKASVWVNATEAFFDGIVYMKNAEMEIDHKNKTQLYGLSEKYLTRSAELYEKAGFARKKDEVMRVLQNVKEKRAFALSMTDVLEAPDVMSSTSLMFTPTPAHEEAVGLEKFEQANIQANLEGPEEAAIGEEIEIQLDLVNVAENPGLLVRIDDLEPSGLKVTKTPPNYALENGSIEMKGKRLEPLKVESIKLSAEATKVGLINLSPKITFVTETGEFRKCRPDVKQITVSAPLAFEFRTSAAEKVFSYLIDAFLKDYVKQKLYIEKSGWRSLVQVIRDANISKASVYGARGRLGPAIAELERRGLIETRVFPGERGRGGKVLKIRISYEKEIIKRHVDKRFMKIMEK